MADWRNPLRRLSPLTENPSVSPSLLPAKTNGSLAILETTVRLDKLENCSYGAAQILRAFLDHLDQNGTVVLAEDILACHDDDERLVSLANHLLDAILKPFKLAGGKAPVPLISPPTDDGHYSGDVEMGTVESSQRSDQSKLRDDCLRRDGHHCVVTGGWDLSSARHGIKPPPGVRFVYCECAHIIPFALGSFDEADAVQTRNMAIIWLAIRRYFPALDGKIDASSINQRSNAMILEYNIHRHFTDYKCTFEHQGHNVYLVLDRCEFPVIAPQHSAVPLQLTSHDDSIPMPDPDFLQTHASIAGILEVSGFGNRISNIIEMGYLDLDCHALDKSGSTDVGGLISRMLLTCVRIDSTDKAGEGDASKNSTGRETN